MNSRFPFATTLDFSPLVDFWRERAEDPSNPWYGPARHVLSETGDIPELNGPIDGPDRLAGLTDSVEMLLSAFQSPTDESRVAAAMTPYLMGAAYTRGWASGMDLVGAMEEQIGRYYSREDIVAGMAMKAYGLILSEIYGVDLGFELPFSWVSFRDIESTVPVQCAETGITRRFALDFDSRFVRVEMVGERPDVDIALLRDLSSELNSLPRLLELLPPDNFAFRGVAVLLTDDVTAESALTAIRDDLLLRDTLTTKDGVLHIQEHVRGFMGVADLELGLIGAGNGVGIEAIANGSAVGRSLLMDDGGAPQCPNRAHSLYAQALEDGRGLVTEDLVCCSHHTGYEARLEEQGLRALMVHPLYVDGELVGMLELGSATAGALTTINFFKLEKLEAVFALGLRRALADREDQVQSVIKREYTAIHPVVEWRFREAARKRLDDPQAPASEIVFEELHPLYGLTDIRDSSTQRNEAISADLETQLLLARDIVDAAQDIRRQPALGEIHYRIQDYLDSLHPGMATEDESSVLAYLQGDLEPLFDRLESLGRPVQDAVRAYRDALDPSLGILYRKRKDFERSVSLVNDIISGVLHEEEKEGQELVPHYFELFKTDGVDYNVYLGASLHRDGRYDPLDLGNLRLWQLMTHVKIQRALDLRREELPVPLGVTHLILAQSSPLAIRFRRDERRFDVDGAYNIRYEIVKKRIDKALIRGSDERLTQPRMLAVAYSQDREAAEYKRHIAYLQRAGYIEDGPVEELELEPLQGVFGLHALRVQIAPDPSETTVSEEETPPDLEGPRLVKGA